jgi:hypothetical protein
MSVSQLGLLRPAEVITALAFCVNVAFGPKGGHGDIAPIRVNALVDKEAS